jgi:UDP-GlcNAc:undecaprenyl-phosphate GlcNAc-1-phosphate transferase
MSFGLYLLGGVGAVVFTAGLVPLWRWWCRQRGWVDDPGPRKIHGQPIPLAGGLAVLSGILASASLLAVVLLGGLRNKETMDPCLQAIAASARQWSALLLGAVGLTVLGWFDDRHELRAAPKFVGQCIIALLVAAGGIRITLFVPSVVFSYFITVLWLLTVINAFNFMDNMNGLCAGLGAIAALALGLASASDGQCVPAALCFVTCGALLGFLPYNFPRASIFLGDAGSHLVGYLLAVLAILPHFYSAQHTNVWAVLKPLLILAVPLGDLMWVVQLRWRLGKPIYVGDNNHLSHRLVRRGWRASQAVLLIWVLALAVAALSFLL